MNQFYEPRKDQASQVKQLKDVNALMCLDWSNVELQGNFDQDTHKVLNVMFLPCGAKESGLAKGAEDRVPENCNSDEHELFKYLENIAMVVYSNSFSFQQDQYGDERLRKESSFERIRVDSDGPNWIPSYI